MIERAFLPVVAVALAAAACAAPRAAPRSSRPLSPAGHAVAPGAAASPAPVPAAGASVLDEIADLVEQKFYSTARLEEVGWRAAVGRARVALAGAPDAAARTAILRQLLATLATSHTDFYPRDAPGYWALASIFEPVLQRTCAKEHAPAFPVARDDIGVFWKQLGGEWFVGGVYAGGPAEQAGLKLGDRVRSADGQPFAPVTAFAGKAGRPVALEVQRSRDGAALALVVTPRSTKPHEELRQATEDSWRLLPHNGKRIAYLHVWTWTSIEIQQVVLEAIARANAAAADGFLLDIRDGWGGAAPHYLGVFFPDVPVLESIDRDGKRQAFDSQLRKPTVLLINGGTRSGKELFAYGARKHHLAQLVGERTAGAVTFGQPFCLRDGSLLFLAVLDAAVDGERLEGRGVAPDLEVPFDLRYAGGKDAQLERALELLAAPGKR